MKRAALLIIVSLSACPLAPASTDSGIDASQPDAAPLVRPAADASIDGLPVTPAVSDCTTSAAQACISGGWFKFPRWSTIVFMERDGGWSGQANQPVFLPSFRLDTNEATNLDWRAYSAATGAPLPPPRCGCQVRGPGEPTEASFAIEVSGWELDGGIAETRLQHPVVCVTRDEAQAFCAWKSGHLPTAAQWMRAVRGAWPSERRSPWGDSPPALELLDPNATWLGAAEYVRDYELVNARAPVGEFGLGVLQLEPVDRRPRGASAEGVANLAGSVSEFVFECEEQLASYGPGGPVVSPDAGPFQSSCARQVFAGSNWYSAPDLSEFGVSSLYGTQPLDGTLGFAPRDVLGVRSCPAMTEFRSWSVGLRCAYDVP